MKAGLLGRKLGHSLSPQIHRLFGDYEYRLYEREPEEMEKFLRTGFADGEFGFLNVTIPYKQDVFRLCDELSPLAQRLGNVNFVMHRADGSLYGDNTDAFGVGRLLETVGAEVEGRKCAILGAGGAAMTVKAVLEERGAAEATFVRRGETPSSEASLIVNATPVGMFPDVDGARIDIAGCPACETVVDLVYNPSPTRLVREALACGKKAADGMVMLIAQAWRAYCLATDVKHDDSCLFLYGPPASGKSTLARKVAAATGRELVDLDAEIVKSAGRSIPEIFAAEGESGFRARELAALKSAADGSGRVIALGGGALLNPEARRIAEASGRVVCLDCALETLLGRLSGGSRPLATDRERLRRLVETRREHYASFPVHVDFQTTENNKETTNER